MPFFFSWSKMPIGVAPAAPAQTLAREVPGASSVARPVQSPEYLVYYVDGPVVPVVPTKGGGRG